MQEIANRTSCAFIQHLVEEAVNALHKGDNYYPLHFSDGEAEAEKD